MGEQRPTMWEVLRDVVRISPRDEEVFATPHPFWQSAKCESRQLGVRVSYFVDELARLLSSSTIVSREMERVLREADTTTHYGVKCVPDALWAVPSCHSPVSAPALCSLPYPVLYFLHR